MGVSLTTDRFIKADEVAELLQCSKGQAYVIIRQLNKELKEANYITLAGRVPRAYFEERCNLKRSIKS